MQSLSLSLPFLLSLSLFHNFHMHLHFLEVTTSHTILLLSLSQSIHSLFPYLSFFRIFRFSLSIYFILSLSKFFINQYISLFFLFPFLEVSFIFYSLSSSLSFSIPPSPTLSFPLSLFDCLLFFLISFCHHVFISLKYSKSKSQDTRVYSLQDTVLSKSHKCIILMITFTTKRFLTIF